MVQKVQSYKGQTFKEAKDFKNFRLIRFFNIRDVIHSFANSGGVTATVEKTNLIDGTDQRPADVYLANWHQRRTCIDVSVFNPMAASNRNAAAENSGHLQQREIPGSYGSSKCCFYSFYY